MTITSLKVKSIRSTLLYVKKSLVNQYNEPTDEGQTFVSQLYSMIGNGLKGDHRGVILIIY